MFPTAGFSSAKESLQDYQKLLSKRKYSRAYNYLSKLDKQKIDYERFKTVYESMKNDAWMIEKNPDLKRIIDKNSSEHFTEFKLPGKNLVKVTTKNRVINLIEILESIGLEEIELKDLRNNKKYHDRLVEKVASLNRAGKPLPTIEFDTSFQMKKEDGEWKLYKLYELFNGLVHVQ